MRTKVAQHGVRGLLEVRPERDLVGHGPGGEEKRVLLAGDLSDVRLEGEGGGLMVDSVAEGRPRGVHVHLGRRH